MKLRKFSAICGLPVTLDGIEIEAQVNTFIRGKNNHVEIEGEK